MTVDIEGLKADIFTEMCALATEEGLGYALSRNDIVDLFSEVPVGHTDLALRNLVLEGKVKVDSKSHPDRIDLFLVDPDAYGEHISVNG